MSATKTKPKKTHGAKAKPAAKTAAKKPKAAAAVDSVSYDPSQARGALKKQQAAWGAPDARDKRAFAAAIDADA
ncbi:MAG TPA: hypothetical protein VH054_24920, partial [Polyangiaceae bacterium]|nr:hypothetical protein [Polyangiaceae bacterium]